MSHLWNKNRINKNRNSKMGKVWWHRRENKHSFYGRVVFEQGTGKYWYVAHIQSKYRFRCTGPNQGYVSSLEKAQLIVEALLVGTDTFKDNNVELVSCRDDEDNHMLD